MLKELLITPKFDIGSMKEPESISKVIISSEVKTLDSSVFAMLGSRMPHLKSIDVEKGNEAYCSKNGVLYNHNCSTLLIYPRGKNRKKFQMPSFVYKIWPKAFSDGLSFPEKLEEISISANVHVIPDNCFKNMNLYTVTIPEGLVSIGERAFENTALVCPTLPKSLKKLAVTAFNNCRLLHILNVREDNFGLCANMLNGCAGNIVIFETIENIDRTLYPGLDVMNLIDLDKWIGLNPNNKLQ